jgi:type I restriction enzyme S subunit
MSDERHELPEGWAWARVEQLAEISAGDPAPQGARYFENGSHPFVRVQDMGRLSGKKFVDETHDLINDRAIGQCRLRLFPEGTVLFTKSGMSTLLNQRGILRRPAYVVSHIGCAVPSGAVTSEWLYYALRQVDLGVLTQATTLPSLKLSKVAQVEVPLAPLPEQRRVVAKIEALFEQSRTARQALDRIPLLLKKFRQAVLAAAFRGDLTRDWREQHPDVEPASALLDRIRTERRHECEGTHRGSKPAERETVDMGDLPELPARWVWCTLGQCTSLITKGESPNWQGYQYVADGVPFVRSENVLWGVLHLSEVARIPDTFHQKLQRSKLKPNDVLVNLVGASIGRCAVVPPELSEANINQAVATIRTTEAMCPPYLLHLLLSPAMQEVIQGKRVEVARPNISLGDLRNLIVPLAPAAEQEHIVCRMEQLFVIVAAIEAALEAARRRADKLEQSILTRAFHGELVPQDPNDEPASAVLDLARARREEASPGRGHTPHARRMGGNPSIGRKVGG